MNPRPNSCKSSGVPVRQTADERTVAHQSITHDSIENQVASHSAEINSTLVSPTEPVGTPLSVSSAIGEAGLDGRAVSSVEFSGSVQTSFGTLGSIGINRTRVLPDGSISDDELLLTTGWPDAVWEEPVIVLNDGTDDTIEQYQGNLAEECLSEEAHALDKLISLPRLEHREQNAVQKSESIYDSGEHSTLSMKETSKDQQLELLEISLMLEGVYRHYGYDFREYAISSLRRRIRELVSEMGLPSVSALQDRILHDRPTWERFLAIVTVNVTGMFRDPLVFKELREKVLPTLRELPFIRIWHAGCATGEEVYSLAILLQEEGLLDRCRIYATDINESVLKRARTGIYPLSAMQEYSRNFLMTGGEGPLSNYYTARYENAILRAQLRDNILFSQHNLVTDSSFNEFHLIFCRNVLIYFSKALQDRVHRLLYNSLTPNGCLVLGLKENLRYTPFEKQYGTVSADARIYSKLDIAILPKDASAPTDGSSSASDANTPQSGQAAASGTSAPVDPRNG